MNKAVFYGVGVGPGEPELLTIKAVRVLAECDVIAAPQTNGENTLALDIVRSAVDISNKHIITLEFAMTRDKAEQQRHHIAAANKITEQLKNGKSVAMISLGDISLYSTFSYIFELVKAEGYNAELVAGVTSFCAVAAALQVSLTEMNKPLHIIPSAGGQLSESLALKGTKVLMKTGRAVSSVKSALKECGLYEKASAVQNCGLPSEKIYRSLDDMDDQAGYFTTIIVKD
ncbi:MAG TPA: precorrin-2 C(20)-methyltransferase [Ruminococcaceae bacterium]|nr:precorrin-2 C(20)-methyltransferase [Oscillospiraceae bacterium]